MSIESVRGSGCRTSELGDDESVLALYVSWMASAQQANFSSNFTCNGPLKSQKCKLHPELPFEGELQKRGGMIHG